MELTCKQLIPHMQGQAMDGDTMLLFLDRVLQWLQAPMTYGRVVNLFAMFDSDKDNLLSADDFTVAMKMMGVSGKHYFL